MGSREGLKKRPASAADAMEKGDGDEDGDFEEPRPLAGKKLRKADLDDVGVKGSGRRGQRVCKGLCQRICKRPWERPWTWKEGQWAKLAFGGGGRRSFPGG